MDNLENLKKELNDAKLEIISLQLIIKRLESKIELPIKKSNKNIDIQFIPTDTLQDK